MTAYSLKILPASLTVVRLDAGAGVPPWALTGGFFSVTGTAAELSVVCDAQRVPDGVRSEAGWRALEVRGPLEFDQVGVLAALAQVLADAGVSIFAVSTYDTDYILLKD